MVVTITILKDECRSDFPEIVAEYDAARHEEAISNVKGACLIAIGQFKRVPDEIYFRVEEKSDA